MKKGDIVKIRRLDKELYVVVKGPYESSFCVNPLLTETLLVVDLYNEQGMWEKIPLENVEVVARS